MIARARNLLIFILVLYGASISLNCVFKAGLAGAQKNPDIIQKIFGGLRDFAGDWAFIKAEEYHHGGMPFLKSAAYHKGGFDLLEDRAHPGADEHEAPPKAQTEGYGLYSQIYSHVKVTSHSHLHGTQMKELLPWFYIEVMFNPHDARGYVVGAYWLHGLDRDEEALKFLMEGAKNNPRSARILGAVGEYYFARKSAGPALNYLERSCQLWLENKEPNIVGEDYSQLDRLSSFDLLGNLYESTGKYREAIKLYGDLYRLDPDPLLTGKIEAAKLKLPK